MKKDKMFTLFLLIGLFTLVALGGGYLRSINKNKKYELYEVKLNEKIDHDMFAIMLETAEDSNDYEERLDNEAWPAGYVLNKNKSNCIDKNGNKIEDTIIRYNESKHIATVEGGETNYCYLYFDVKTSFTSGTGTDLAMSNVKGLEMTIDPKDDMDYRFVGDSADSVDNYICFGTYGTCTVDDNEMYRIIGIDKKGRLKLIKQNSIGEHTVMASGGENSSSFPTSDLALELNGNLMEKFVPQTWEQWENRIDENIWNTGKLNNVAKNWEMWADEESPLQGGYGKLVLSDEQQSTSTYASKIGLMYLSDYYYAKDIKGNTNCAYNVNNDICKSWMDFVKEDGWALTMDADSEGVYGFNFLNFAVTSSFSTPGDIYPVFYLDSNVVITGKGTKISPYVLKASVVNLIKLHADGYEVSTDEKDELSLRFLGKNTPNYICLGTKSKCNPSDDTMYRIVGVTKDGKIKVVKNKSISNEAWDSKNNKTAVWDQSNPATLYEKVTVSYEVELEKQDWFTRLVEKRFWNIGDVPEKISAPNYAANIMKQEQSKKTERLSRLGLLYLSDIYYADDINGANNCASRECNKNSNNWIMNSMPGAWTMTKTNTSKAWSFYDSYVGADTFDLAFDVYPVFYLDENVTPINDEAFGTIEDPYTVA